MDKLTAIRIKYDDGTYSEEIPVSALAEDIIWNSSHNLVDILGEVDLTKGNIQQQLNEKFNSDDISTYVDTQISTDVTAWLNEHVNPVGSAVVVDNSLTTAGAAADAQKTGEYLRAIIHEYDRNGGGYPPGTYVVYNNLLYQSLQMTAFAPPAPPNSEYWRMVSLNEAISELLGIVAEPYHGQGEDYAVGDYCIYNNILYRCTTAIQTSDAFDSSKWEVVDKSLIEMLSEKAEQTEVDQLNERLGDLDELETTVKTDIVSAINEIVSGSGTGLTENTITALLNCFQHVAWVDENGQIYYNALHDALNAITAITLNVGSLALRSLGATSQLVATTTPSGGSVIWESSDTSVATVSNDGLVTSIGYGSCVITASSGDISANCSVLVSLVTVESISASYVQSGTVYTTDSLDSLKTDIVVTATYSDTSTSIIDSEDYALSGTLIAGTSTITVSYGGQTATISVTVTEAAMYPLSDNSSGNVIISNGNTFSCTSPNGYATYFALYQHAAGAAGILKNKSKVFTIPANTDAVLTLDVTSANLGNSKIQFGLYNANTDSGNWYDTNSKVTGVYSHTFNFETDKDISDVFIYASAITSIAGTVSLVVGGVKFI